MIVAFAAGMVLGMWLTLVLLVLTLDIRDRRRARERKRERLRPTTNQPPNPISVDYFNL